MEPTLEDLRDAPVCALCEKLSDVVKHKCHYLNCPYRNKLKMPVPVKKEPELRTLWTLPPTPSTSQAHKPFVDLFDGTLLLQPHSIIREGDVVFFDGGTDVDPALYGEKPHIATSSPDKERDERERHAFKRAQAAGASCLGVCRGAQFLCVMSGGKLLQDVSGHYGGSHMIRLAEGSMILSESSHHQVMWPDNIPHVLIAWSDYSCVPTMENHDEYAKEPDGDRFAEMIYCKDTRSLCIQGHTEWMSANSVFSNFTRQLVREYLIEGR